MASTIDTGQSNIFDTLIENLKLVNGQLKDGESSRKPDPDFKLDVLWQRLDGASKALSRECTKLCLAYSGEPVPSPEQFKPVTTGIEQASLVLVSAFYSLPKDKGVTLRKYTRDAIVTVIDSVQVLIKDIQTNGCHGAETQKQHTGNVWDCCDNMAHLPKDNKEAALKKIQQARGLVQDAFTEIEEVQKDENDGTWDDMEDILQEEGNEMSNEDKWTEADKQLLGPATGLVKATKSALKKITSAIKSNGSCQTEDCVSQLDDIADLVSQISPLVDDLICCLYAPMKHDDVKENAEELAVKLKNLLELAKHTHVTTEDDASWVDFLRNALQHNLDKLLQHGGDD